MKQQITRTLTAALILLALSLAAVPAFAATDRVNINTANVSQLDNLPRIGPALSFKIVEYRDQNGPFKTTDDLKQVRGIGERTYELLTPFVAIAGETTLSHKVSTAEAEEAANGGGSQEDQGTESEEADEKE